MLQIFMLAIQAGLCASPEKVVSILESDLGEQIVTVQTIPMPSPKPAALIRFESQENGTFSFVVSWQDQSYLVAFGTLKPSKGV